MKHSMLFALIAIAGLGFSVALTSPVQANETTCMACYSYYKRCVTRAETPEQEVACNTRYHSCRRSCTTN